MKYLDFDSNLIRLPIRKSKLTKQDIISAYARHKNKKVDKELRRIRYGFNLDTQRVNDYLIDEIIYKKRRGYE